MPCMMQMTGPVLDMIYRVEAVPASGQEAVVTGFSGSVGGGFNALVAARAAGIDAILGGTLGVGPVASVVSEALTAHAIRCARPALAGHDQGCCTVLVEPDGERTFVAWPGAEGQIPAGALERMDLGRTDWVLLSGYTLHYPGSRDALAEWIPSLPRSVRLLFDPSPLIAELPAAAIAAVLGRADWVSANASEAAALTGAASAEHAAGKLALGREGAVVRRGPEGCILATGGALHAVPGHVVEVVDTTGAGDCHIGSFVAELALTGDPARAARYATVAAALSVTREGPATPPSRAEVLALMGREEEGPEGPVPTPTRR